MRTKNRKDRNPPRPDPRSCDWNWDISRRDRQTYPRKDAVTSGYVAKLCAERPPPASSRIRADDGELYDRSPETLTDSG